MARMASSLVLIGLLISVPAALCGPVRAYESVVDYVKAQPDLSTVLALVADAGLADALGPDFDGTVFLPINKAFDDIKDKTATLTKDDLKAILLYHASAEFVDNNAFRKTQVIDSLLEGHKLQLRKGGGGSINKVNDAAIESQRTIAKAKVYLIDQVLIPDEDSKKLVKSVVDFAVGKPELSTIVKIVTDLALADALGPGFKGTAFLPTDAAFEAIKEVADGLTEEQLRFIVMYHVSNKAFSKSDFKDGVTGFTALGQIIKVSEADKLLKVNNATCVELVAIGQGAACVVDQVLIPTPVTKPFSNIVDFVKATPDLSTLLSVVGEYPDLVEALSSKDFAGSVFLPSNKAFEEVASVIPTLSKDEIKGILAYHAVVGKTLRPFDFARASPDNEVATLNGAKVVLGRSGSSRLTVNGNRVTDQSRAAFATIYLLDKVLLPPKAETKPDGGDEEDKP